MPSRGKVKKSKRPIPFQQQKIPRLVPKTAKIQIRYRQAPVIVRGRVKKGSGKLISEKKALSGKVFYRIEFWRYFYSSKKNTRIVVVKGLKKSKRRWSDTRVILYLKKIHARWKNPPVIMKDPKTGKLVLVIMSP